MKTARVKSLRVIAVLALAVTVFAGCDDDEDQPPETPATDSEKATEAAKQIPQDAPTRLPDSVPEDLVRVTIGGVSYDLRELLGRASGSRPSAHIVAAYQTVDTPSDPPPFGTSDRSASPDYTRSAPAAQVYECRETGGSISWVFLQPEAGLQPITTEPVQSVELLVLDHFRYPGGIDYGSPTDSPPAGPSWRVSSPALGQDSLTSGQTLFIGAVESTVPNGADNVPLLRLANVARVDQGLPAEVFSRSTADGSQTGYVLRLNTRGGVAPATGCSVTADLGKRERVPYSADYYFIDVFPTL